MTLYEKEETRAVAVQAAAQMLGDAAYWRRDLPGGGVEYLPSPAYIELSNRIGEYVLTGKWKGPAVEK